MYKHVICTNIDQLWKSGREPLRYFYKDSSQAGMTSAGLPTHDPGIKSSFGKPLIIDQDSSDPAIVRVTTAVTLDNVYKNIFSLGSERLSRDEYCNSMFGLPKIERCKDRIPEKECKKYLSRLFNKCLYSEEHSEKIKFHAWLTATLSQKVVDKHLLEELCAGEKLASDAYDRICQSSKPMDACFAFQIDSKNRVQDVVEVLQKTGLQEKGRDDITIFLNDGKQTTVSSGYRRIVYGDHGPYIELEKG